MHANAAGQQLAALQCKSFIAFSHAAFYNDMAGKDRTTDLDRERQAYFPVHIIGLKSST